MKLILSEHEQGQFYEALDKALQFSYLYSTNYAVVLQCAGPMAREAVSWQHMPRKDAELKAMTNPCMILVEYVEVGNTKRIRFDWVSPLLKGESLKIMACLDAVLKRVGEGLLVQRHAPKTTSNWQERQKEKAAARKK